MEYLEGGSVHDNLKYLKVFSEDHVQFISAQVICAIQFLHSNEIVHR